MPQRRKPAAQPVHQLGALLLGKLHGADMLVQRGAQLLHLAVPLVVQRVIDKDQRTVLREVLQQCSQLHQLYNVADLAWDIEKIHIFHRHQRVLGHHGHGLHHLGQRLHRQALAAEVMVVELLEPRRDQQLPHLLQIPGPEIRLLAVKDIDILHLLRLQVGLQTGKTLMFRHVRLLHEW